MSRRISRNYIAAWLALFSIAMLFVAPVISKSISHRTACEHHVSAMSMPGMYHSMVMKDPCQKMSDSDHRMMSGQAMSPVEEIACGYCQLLIHLPFVPIVVTALLWLLRLFVQRSPVLHAAFLPVIRTWDSQCARAPPAVFSAAI